MLVLKSFSLFMCLLILIGGTHGSDKYTDENRPYEFGFTIEGEQHRHEKKDENGLIMGEFGFITADGVYHVTVYATDDNGRFKILSMKNIRVKPYPTAGVKKGHSLPFPPSENAPVLQGPTKSYKSAEATKSIQTEKQIAVPAKSCSHCSLPTTTTTTTKAPLLTDLAIVSRDRPIPGTPELKSPEQISKSVSNQVYQQTNTQLLNSHQQDVQGRISPANQKEANIKPHFQVSDLGRNNIPFSKRIEQNIPQSQNPYIQEGRFGDQNYVKQDLAQNNQQHDVSSNPNLQESRPGKPHFQPESTVYLNNPQEGSILNLNKEPKKYANSNLQNRNQNDPQFVKKEIQNSNNVNNANQYYTQGGNNNDQNYFQQRDGNKNSVQQGSPFSLPQSMEELFEQHNSDKTTPDNFQTPQGKLRNPKQYSPTPPPNIGTSEALGFEAALASQGNKPTSDKPTLVAAQIQIVPKDTDIHYKRPGEKDGLPDGLSKDDMTQLLYTFNYTVGFHGHHEKGYTNGAKEGYYYVTGRNGVRTRIDYIADSNGFRPRISQDVLDLLSDDVPKQETEKDEKFGLKGYEFKWLYYPADDKQK